ncbi:metallophosphoesterase family protein [Thalassovita sp.]|uniref:metallophosphoesterase family protein n=1 Tax=Thalassovita sp. TaxID=1979401 RepID=UPI0029DE6F05|nr:metallophosphoesterase family protein [Thalassovita sp.]
MRIHHIGELRGQVLLFGGPYSNLPATQALLARGQGMAKLCTGDVVAYGADPMGCIAALRAADVPVVAGNCERQLAARAQDCGCGFDAGSVCGIAARGWFAHADAQVTAAARAWMDGLPDILTFDHSGRRFAAIHGGVSAINRFLWSCSPEADFRAELALLRAATGPVDAVIAGHSGIAFRRAVDGTEWINAGVIGMPPHDGRPQTEYAVLSGGAVEFHRLDYDHFAAARAMEKAGLTQGYETALITGYWPSQDILPDQLRLSPRANG